MIALIFLRGYVSQVQLEYPKLVSAIHWLNPGFTLGTFLLSHDTALKLLAFLFVTVPLGVVQWWNLLDRIKERRAKKNAAR